MRPMWKEDAFTSVLAGLWPQAWRTPAPRGSTRGASGTLPKRTTDTSRRHASDIVLTQRERHTPLSAPRRCVRSTPNIIRWNADGRKLGGAEPGGCARSAQSSRRESDHGRCSASGRVPFPARVSPPVLAGHPRRPWCGRVGRGCIGCGQFRPSLLTAGRADQQLEPGAVYILHGVRRRRRASEREYRRHQHGPSPRH